MFSHRIRLTTCKATPFAARLMVTAAGVALAVGAAHAQTASGETASAPAARPAQSSGLEEIVVTARKSAENLQDVPVAVTAMTGSQLQVQSALTVQDIARTTPGFVTRESSSNPSAINLTIRGQVQNDVLVTLDPSVGTYVDEVYWARAYGANADLLDLSNVQVLRGPQGTLFGRNTTGGAILINTNNPDPFAFGGEVSGTYGRFNERSVTGILNVPIIEDVFAVRGAIKKLKRDGYLTDAGYANNIGGQAGEKYNSRDTLTGRVKALIRPTETLEIVLSGEYYKTDSTLGANQTIYAMDTGGASSVRSIAAAAGYDIDDYIARVKDDPDYVSLNTMPLLNVKTHTYNALVRLETGFGEVKVIGSHRDIDSFSQMDLDGSPFAAHTTLGYQDVKQQSVEAQISGSTVDDAIDFVAGLSYFHESGYDRSFSSGDESNPTGSLLEGIVNNDAYGIYAQGTWHATDLLSFTGGLRYSVEDKGIEINNRVGTLAQLETGGALQIPVAPGVTYNFCLFPTASPTPNSCSAQRSDAFRGLSYTFGVDYKVAPDVLIYAKTSKGFRSGGENLRAILTPLAFVPFDPEVSYQHEIGLKSQFLDNRVRFNVAAYYTKIKDFQSSLIVGGPTGSATIVQNAADVSIWGIEADALVEVFNGFNLSASAATTRPKFDEYVDFYGNDVSDNNFRLVPDYQFSLSATYTAPLTDDIGMSAYLGYSWVDSIYQDEINTPALVSSLTTPSGGSLNGRLNFSFMDKKFEVAAFGRNILNNRDLNNALLLESPYAYINGRFREPATYGLEATFRFGDL